MNNILEVGVVASAILGSFFLALLIEWLSLRGLMRLMPASAERPAGSNSGVALRIR